MRSFARVLATSKRPSAREAARKRSNADSDSPQDLCTGSHGSTWPLRHGVMVRWGGIRICSNKAVCPSLYLARRPRGEILMQNAGYLRWKNTQTHTIHGPLGYEPNTLTTAPLRFCCFWPAHRSVVSPLSMDSNPPETDGRPRRPQDLTCLSP